MMRHLLGPLAWLLLPLACAQGDGGIPGAQDGAGVEGGMVGEAGVETAGAQESSRTVEQEPGMTPEFAAAAAAAAAAATAAAEEDASPEEGAPAEPTVTLPTEWLVIDKVDGRGRRPLRPDVVFAAHMWGRDAPFPREGDTLTGENGEYAWERREANDKGAPTGEGGISWAFTQIELPADGVMIAKAQRAMALWVNGEPYAGDYYGFGQGGVPVAVKRGVNTFAMSVIRGRPSLTLQEPAGALVRSPWHDQRPFLVEGETDVGPVGIGLMNATELTTAPLRVTLLQDDLFAATSVERRGLAPLETTQVALSQVLREGAVPVAGDDAHRRQFEVHVGDDLMLTGEVSMKRIDAFAVRRRTFVSEIDGTVQYYGVRPPSEGEAIPGATVGIGADAGLVLSLHGAGVHAIAQARSYSSRPDFWIVAPTNRSPFGFDWQDWGRRDAYEVLEHALAYTGTRRSRVYLAGHSMGGHGAWHLAANDPDGFAAVAPSAGWESFDSYGGRPDGALADLWRAADKGSETLELIDNLVQVPAYVLHGGGDNNVPPSEGETMIAALTEAGAPPEWHIEPGKGHWWNGDNAPGVDCLDWTPIFDLFRRSALPEGQAAGHFTTVDPSYDSRHFGVEVLQPRVYGSPASVDAQRDGGTLNVVTRNVRALAIHDHSGPVTIRQPRRPLYEFTASADESLHVRLDRAGAWHAFTESEFTAESGKRPESGGPFKRALDRRMAIVVGTAGTAEETRELWGRARALAEEWAYRAFGHIPVMTDEAFLANGHDGNLILLGNADSNAAWDRLATRIDDGSPSDANREYRAASSWWFRAERGRIRLFDDEYTGDDLACLIVAARNDGPDGLVAVIGDSGPRGTRLHAVTAPLVSGVGIPDVVVFDSQVLSEGDRGVRAAGWWSSRWYPDAWAWHPMEHESSDR